MAPRALITGATGLLGREVVKAFEKAGYDVIGTGFSRAAPPQIVKLDIRDEAEVARVLDEVKPQAVVHCAADRQPDSCTRNPDAARHLNVTATSHLAKACASRGIFLLYISTDYVFPGIQGQAPYRAHDKPSPPNIYGQTKADGEQAVLDNTQEGRAAVLRVPVLYGPVEPEGNNKESAVNVLMDILWKSQQQGEEKIKVDHWAIRYPTNTADVGRVCADVVKHYTSSSTPSADRPSILQFSSEDKLTKYEICQLLAEIMGLHTANLVPDEDGGQPGPDGTVRPYDCHLDTSTLRRLGIDVETVPFTTWWRLHVRAFKH